MSEKSEINFNYIKCTKCSKNLTKFITDKKYIPLHPVLGVPFCEKCCEFYGDGNFSTDEDGDDKYCRWCGDGGDLFLCTGCKKGFCRFCVEKHFGESFAKQVEESEEWVCFLCCGEDLSEYRGKLMLDCETFLHRVLESHFSVIAGPDKHNSESAKPTPSVDKGTVECTDEDIPADVKQCVELLRIVEFCCDTLDYACRRRSKKLTAATMTKDMKKIINLCKVLNPVLRNVSMKIDNAFQRL